MGCGVTRVFRFSILPHHISSGAKVSTPQEAIALKFIGSFRESWPKDLDATVALLAEDAVFQLVVPTSPPIRGRAVIKADILRMKKRVPEQTHELKAVGSGGNAVFVERIDHLLVNKRWAKIPIVGVFEVGTDGLITEWREYMDLAHVAREYGTPIELILRSFEPRGSSPSP